MAVRSLKTGVCNENCDRLLIIMMLLNVDIINMSSQFIKHPHAAQKPVCNTNSHQMAMSFESALKASGNEACLRFHSALLLDSEIQDTGPYVPAEKQQDIISQRHGVVALCSIGLKGKLQKRLTGVSIGAGNAV